MEQRRGLCQLHGAVLLFGLSGLFGKVIRQNSLVITWGRVVFSALALALLLKAKGEKPWAVPHQTKAALAALGALLAFHWSTFYQAIQVSTVAVGLISFSAFPIFVTFLEPWFTGRKPRGRDMALAFAAFGGILAATPLDGEGGLWLGVLWGLLSGLSYALLGLFNQKWVGALPAEMISFWEQTAAAVLLTPCLLWLRPALALSDWAGLLLLGVVFTALSHTLFISSLRTIRAQTASVVSCLEPVYGILLAAVFLGEIPSLRQVLGGGLVFACAIWGSLKKEARQ